jgi:hypothetical protein
MTKAALSVRRKFMSDTTSSQIAAALEAVAPVEKAQTIEAQLLSAGHLEAVKNLSDRIFASADRRQGGKGAPDAEVIRVVQCQNPLQSLER